MRTSYWVLVASFILWSGLSLTMLIDASRLRNWHAASGWAVATLFVCLFFLREILYGN